MNRFKIISNEYNLITVIVYNNDIIQVNLLRHAILSYIELYAIDVVVFHENSTSREDEALAIRFGQLPIDNESYKHGEDFKTRLNVSNHSNISITVHSTDIPDIPFSCETPLVELAPGQKLICDLIVKKNQAKEHVKWRPVGSIGIKQVDDGFIFRFKTLNMISPEHIIEYAFDKIQEVRDDTPNTKFSKVVT
jgi:DNA-directed RNA polymerase alpha subunit